jgi:LysR family transcriptional activator of nhaA
MDDLNYHHLQYFWLVAKEGSIAKAAARLKVSQPTISTQLRRLEQAVKKPLFRKRGRNLELTAVGRQAFEYADRIFTIGQELTNVLHGRAMLTMQPFHVGIQTGMPADLVDRWLRPVLHLPGAPRLVCRTGELWPLIVELRTNRVQVVLSAEAIEAASLSGVVCRLLSEAAVVVRGREEVIQRYRRGFPKSLEGAPLLWPGTDLPLRHQLDAWFSTHRIHPDCVAESTEATSLDLLALAGHGLVLAPQAGESATGPLSSLGPLPGLTIRYYAFHRDEPILHPALTAVFE